MEGLMNLTPDQIQLLQFLAMKFIVAAVGMFMIMCVFMVFVWVMSLFDVKVFASIKADNRSMAIFAVGFLLCVSIFAGSALGLVIQSVEPETQQMEEEPIIQPPETGNTIFDTTPMVDPGAVSGKVVPFKWFVTKETQYDQLFQDYAQIYWPIDWRWFKAQGIAESKLDPFAVSHCGAMGLMQFMPVTAKDEGLLDPWNPEYSVMHGIKYDRKIDKIIRSRGYMYPMPDRLRPVFAGYNWGPGAILKSMDRMDDPSVFDPDMPNETTVYVKKIFQLKKRMK